MCSIRFTALHLAGRSGHAAVCDALVKAGADVDAERAQRPVLARTALAVAPGKGAAGETALHCAAWGGHGGCCEALANLGANVYALDPQASRVCSTCVLRGGRREFGSGQEWRGWVPGAASGSSPVPFRTRQTGGRINPSRARVPFMVSSFVAPSPLVSSPLPLRCTRATRPCTWLRSAAMRPAYVRLSLTAAQTRPSERCALSAQRFVYRCLPLCYTLARSSSQPLVAHRCPPLCLAPPCARLVDARQGKPERAHAGGHRARERSVGGGGAPEGPHAAAPPQE